jgi:ABC-type oligopeptide transport system substrate-binding subunit
MKRYKMKKLKKNIALVSALAAGTIVAGGTATTISEISQHNVGTFAHSASVGDVTHKSGSTAPIIENLETTVTDETISGKGDGKILAT